ncbi:TPA: H-NS family nucleoid-associated regulatory protein [Burkholderia contaminans]|uniref:H-NS family nucleoid-associated regulatory protein n=1 Tax=Burkholderia TaxID=32008 RepID=UPI0009BCBAA8|nr:MULTISPECIES: H-NS family nucleoid-associated regulatory protein [Burkholderia]MBM6430716.1 H-NS histone family protein [Burkholderia contaminans]MBR8015168.1 H-NS histone family protein [Burkholderia vietnamiensis]MDN8026107.1 H-NS family nucleoid-associated regulatory protein [Burkholderia contaminans]PRE01309.1 hypothetical protein C6P91_24080 [Burkholderia multivorans]PRG09411.1 hypothetical protein C6Q17_18535 [Burkholderia contaminans]
MVHSSFPAQRGRRAGDLRYAETEAAAKYRDDEPGAMWSGRGRPPTWIVGKDRSLFEIQPDSVRS